MMMPMSARKRPIMTFIVIIVSMQAQGRVIKHLQDFEIGEFAKLGWYTSQFIVRKLPKMKTVGYDNDNRGLLSM
jgi:hypothetical protein